MTSQSTGSLREDTANIVIADWLNTTGRQWEASGERARTIQDSPRDRPDIIVVEGDRMPVIVECEYDDSTRPGVADAAKRLGKKLQGESREFSEVIAVGIAAECKTDTNAAFRERLERDEPIFTVQLVSGDSENPRVWPSRPLPATPHDLVAYCEYAQVPQTLIDEQSQQIAARIQSSGIHLLNSIQPTTTAQSTVAKLRSITGSDHDQAATQTTCAIWLIAIDLQNDLAQYSQAMQALNLQTTEQLQQAAISGKLTAPELRKQWEIIRQVNYLPVIELAIDTLDAGSMGNAIADLLDELHEISVQLNALHAKHIYNFAGELWQRLVTDREERAAHYTKPEVAELLATLAAERFGDLTADGIAKINLMDAACGTGTLVGAGERALRRKYAAGGGRDANLHRKRMEEHIYAMDVNGIAGTLTAKRLTDMNVEQDYAGSKIAVITHPAGSLALMDPGMTGVSRVLGYRNVTPTPGLGGDEDQGIFHVMAGGIQWTLMNPPYARPRKGRKQATTGLAPLRRAAKKGNNPYKMSNGQAGLATDFGDLCNIRLAFNGVYSTVLPQTAAHAGTWTNWRSEVEKDFDNIVAIANTSSENLESMSADTGMSEMLVVATKKRPRPSNWRKTEILCVNLSVAPSTMAEGYALAKEIAAIPGDSKQGSLTHGNYIRAPQDKPGEPWGAVGNSNNELIQVSMALLNGQAYDPLTLQTNNLALPTVTLGDLAETGPTHHLIGHPKGGDPIGAFEWTPLSELDVAPAQQSMWATDGKAQTSINAKPTHGGTIVDETQAKRMVAKRSNWHLNKNLRFTSQATAIAFTKSKSHGGNAWNAIQEIEETTAKCVALFGNSIFGIVVRTSHSQTTQPGRSLIKVKGIPGLPFPAFNADTPDAKRARDIAERHFDELADLTLEPFSYCFRDKNRHRIDNVVAEMLGLDPEDETVQEMLTHYRLLFAREPNVNGRQQKIMDALSRYGG